MIGLRMRTTISNVSGLIIGNTNTTDLNTESWTWITRTHLGLKDNVVLTIKIHRCISVMNLNSTLVHLNVICVKQLRSRPFCPYSSLYNPKSRLASPNEVNIVFPWTRRARSTINHVNRVATNEPPGKCIRGKDISVGVGDVFASEKANKICWVCAEEARTSKRCERLDGCGVYQIVVDLPSRSCPVKIKENICQVGPRVF